MGERMTPGEWERAEGFNPEDHQDDIEYPQETLERLNREDLDRPSSKRKKKKVDPESARRSRHESNRDLIAGGAGGVRDLGSDHERLEITRDQLEEVRVDETPEVKRADKIMRAAKKKRTAVEPAQPPGLANFEMVEDETEETGVEVGAEEIEALYQEVEHLYHNLKSMIRGLQKAAGAPEVVHRAQAKLEFVWSTVLERDTKYNAGEINQDRMLRALSSAYTELQDLEIRLTQKD